MQIWEIDTENDNNEQFGFKVIYDNSSNLETWQHFYYLTAAKIGACRKSELWVVEQQDKTFKTKAKFKWEKH